MNDSKTCGVSLCCREDKTKICTCDKKNCNTVNTDGDTVGNANVNVVEPKIKDNQG